MKDRDQGSEGTAGLEALLAGCPLFGGLTEGDRRELARLCRIERFAPHDRVFASGDHAHEFLMVVEGEVELGAPGIPPTRRGPGDGFGELGLVPGQLRRADARAGAEGALVARLPRLAFERLAGEAPERFASMVGTLSDKVAPLGLRVVLPEDQGTLLGTPRILAMTAPRDGFGRSTVAVNLATLMAVEGMQVALVDLDPSGGDVALLTQVEPTRDWTRIFPEDGGEADLSPARLRDYLLPAGGGLRVLPAPADPDRVRVPTPRDASRLVKALGRAFDAVVIDAPTGTGPLARAVFGASDLTLVVAGFTSQAVLATERQLSALGRAGFRYPSVQVVLSRVGRPDDSPVDEAEALRQPALARVLEDPEVAVAAGSGRPDVLLRPSGTLALACRRIWRRLDHVVRRVTRLEPILPAARRQSAKARLAEGRSLFVAGRLVEARRELEAAVFDLPAVDPEGLVLLARIYEARGESRRAVECLRAACEGPAPGHQALVRLAALTRSPVWMARAGKAMEEVADLDRPDVWLCRGLLEMARGEPGRAGEAFATAVARKPGYPEAERHLGDLAAIEGRAEAAVGHYRRAREGSPPELLAWWGGYRIHRTLGLIGPAARMLEELLALLPDHPQAGSALVELRREQDRLDTEIEAYRRALELRPGYPDVKLLLAGALARRGKAIEASREAHQALASGAALPGARLLLRKVRVLLADQVSGAALEAA